MIDYSKAIKKLKKTLDLSDSDLGKLLGVSGNAVWHWTSGRTSPRGSNKAVIDKELVKNNLATQEELNGNGTETAQPKKKKASEPPAKRGRKSAAAAADRNLLKTYYTQLAAEKKINSFHLELQGINRKHVKDLPPEVWAEIMTIIEDF